VVIAPDRHGAGTNAILVPASGCEFAFGAGSLARHIMMADARGLRVQICKKPALAFDLDTAEDFAQWLRSGSDMPPFLAARRAA
jgi:2-phospho-L-lactate guanylyltransferase